MEAENKYYQIRLLSSLPWLVHGFGQAGFEANSLKREFPLFSPVEMKQQHSNRVIFLDGKPETEIEADGLVTATPGLLLLVKTADCLPVFLVDPKKHVVAAVHCGWRGTKEKIILRAVEIMQKKAGSDPHELLAGFGPCIERGCYEVGREVFDEFRRNGFKTEEIFQPAEKSGKFYLDLRLANLLLLTREAELSQINISQVEECTFCRKNLHSYRRDRQTQARLFNFIGLVNYKA